VRGRMGVALQTQVSRTGPRPVCFGKWPARACGRAGVERAASTSSHVEDLYTEMVVAGQIEDEPRQRELARRLGALQERLLAKSRVMEAKVQFLCVHIFVRSCTHGVQMYASTLVCPCVCVFV
jgi:hypothetical protein